MNHTYIQTWVNICETNTLHLTLFLGALCPVNPGQSRMWFECIQPDTNPSKYDCCRKQEALQAVAWTSQEYTGTSPHCSIQLVKLAPSLVSYTWFTLLDKAESVGKMNFGTPWPSVSLCIIPCPWGQQSKDVIPFGRLTHWVAFIHLQTVFCKVGQMSPWLQYCWKRLHGWSKPWWIWRELGLLYKALACRDMDHYGVWKGHNQTNHPCCIDHSTILMSVLTWMFVDQGWKVTLPFILQGQLFMQIQFSQTEGHVLNLSLIPSAECCARFDCCFISFRVKVACACHCMGFVLVLYFCLNSI